ncbi:hypothetical protein PENANT_c021G02759 [Penicillium antarcticum]|uniref:Uncharacterized protein n=1 Tax=Penicillium antarcticum TaxID=416450 RepID=A0A1V6Q0B7_9EURO|nr:hypothetical protein PENANT_c021G02759 [Penicillium antarcticum]
MCMSVIAEPLCGSSNKTSVRIKLAALKNAIGKVCSSLNDLNLGLQQSEFYTDLVLFVLVWVAFYIPSSALVDSHARFKAHQGSLRQIYAFHILSVYGRISTGDQNGGFIPWKYFG